MCAVDIKLLYNFHIVDNCDFWNFSQTLADSQFPILTPSLSIVGPVATPVLFFSFSNVTVIGSSPIIIEIS